MSTTPPRSTSSDHPGRRRSTLTILVSLAVTAVVILWSLGVPGFAPDLRADLPPGGGPVVLELFTSQGCSSCPPADRLLTRLGDDPDLSTRVFPLSFHVDYWNYIGWTDPFSSERWSDRQRVYARAFDSNRVYTPQLVVNGEAECVGSQERTVDRLVREALARKPAGAVHLRLAPGENPNRLRAIADAELVADVPAAPELWMALYQKDLTTSVARGENADRTLHNDYVVRQLSRAFALPGSSADAEGSGEVTFTLEPSWNRSDLGVVAFLQDPRTREIHGAARATLEIMQ
ncbi:MAG: DUF1223 domain-containing protein [Acidobacteriota bacterium]